MKEPVVDRVGLRFGAGLSAAVLVLGFAADVDVVVPIVGAALFLGVVLGPGNAPLAWIFKALKASVLRGLPAEPEPATPPRFAQGLGATVLVASTAALFAGAEGLGWGLALLVSALQALLATTGICIGCEMYLFMKRMSARGA